MATLRLVGWVDQTNLMVHATMRAMQKPKVIPERTNFLPPRRFSWKMVMWVAAPRMKSTRKTEVMGSSRSWVGEPPRPAVVGG